jgi:PAS domain S-box-containing protein
MKEKSSRILSVIALIVAMLFGILAFRGWLPQYDFSGSAVYAAVAFLFFCVAVYFARPVFRENFEYSMLTGFVLIILITLVISVYPVHYNYEITTSFRLVERSRKVIHEAEQVLSFAKDIESGARGYVIFEDSSYLEHIAIAEDSVFGHIRAMKELTKDSRSQQEKIDSLTAMIHRRIEFSQQLIRSRNENGFAEAQQMMATLRGKIYTDRIREWTAGIQQEENDLLLQRQKKNDKSISAFSDTFRILLISLVILLVTIFFITRYNLMKRKKAEAESKEREEQIQAIFRGAPDAVIAMDDQGNVVRWNQKAEVLFGWTENEMIGQPLSDHIIPHRYREAHKKGMRHFIRSGEGPVLNKTVEIQALHKNGREFDVALSISPMVIKGKYLFVGFIRDITAHKKNEVQIQRQREDIQAFMDSMSTLCAKVTPGGKFLLVNKTALSASGLSMEELMDTNFLEGNWWTFDPEVHARIHKAFRRACAGIAINYDENIFAFGRVLSINFSLIPIFKPDGVVDYIVAEGRDITSLKVTETELLKQTVQLGIVNSELESFSYSVSHDLRTPLRAIHGYTQMLSEKYVAQLDDGARNMMNAVLRNTAKMGRLIDELLTFSKLGKKELQITPVDMTGLATGALNDIRNSLPSVKANITLLPLAAAHADPNLMNQVFANLISNAIKYSGRKDNPVIEIGSKEESTEIIYYVKDNGVGFDMKYYDKLFGVFQRLHGADDFEGTGVGLALVKRIVTRHGGKVWAEAELGKGAIFYFSLNKKQ